MKNIKSTSLLLGVASAMAFAQDGAPCIPFVNGTGHYGDNCYNAGLDDMVKGKCYTMNPDRKLENPQWINNFASQTWWWVETDCIEAPASSSSVEESSSSVAPASSSSEVVSSSSEEPASSSSEVASSSSEEPASSSSEVVSSSSAEPVSSSSEIVVVSKCVEFVNGSGNYNGKCFNAGLNDMAEGKCYKINPERGQVNDLWINNRAVDAWWWVETPCADEPASSSSVAESSSSVEESSSSVESSSSEEVSSSSVESSSSEELSSSSEESSSSVEESSSSVEESSSSVESSSSEEVSSSSVQVEIVELCIDYNGKTINKNNVADNCYKSGLKNMAKNTCYTINPEVKSTHGRGYEGYSTDVTKKKSSYNKYWWITTPCTAEIIVSSSSEEVSSSSEEVSSSSEEVSSSSEEVSSSSEEVSSSSEEISSSSEEVSSSSEEISSSSEEVSSSSEEISSSSEEVSSSSEEVSSSSEESSSSVEESSSSEIVVVSKCVEFVNGSGNYNGKCFNAGLNDMAEGKCYMLNPERGQVNDLWINNRAVDSWWWVETACSDEPESSSSVVESSSSVEESSSSVESSSSEEVSSSSEESSSSVEESSSSVESSSSEEVSSSSEELSSSSEESSSSVEPISSSSEVVVSKCIEFVNGSGNYDINCYNDGLLEMAEGKCYALNPDRIADGQYKQQWINNIATQDWWWTEVPCDDEPIILIDDKIKPIEKVLGRDNGTTAIAAAVEAKSNIAFMNNTLSIATTSNGAKTVKVFSVRGDMLLSETFSGASMSLDMSKFAGKGAVIVRLAEGRKVLATKRIAVR
ncbi:hypothetical protein [Fibrobacter sp. UWB12]|uniref:hypothetical protein n=1 Tax=Fibrobacter sp. UWB12 TaxID=1896203 RepID=UPI00091D256F|nr:hypothetical protein [Fibrobacter sp. UWB12]SHK27602.1 hypothetical protein SAMN05720759_101462 [Fibrobacter sp. UWB12]